MAKVRAGDRAKTKRRTGSAKYPMETASQVSSAIRLRHHGKGVSASTVLARASRAVSRLKNAGKISSRRATMLRSKIATARAKDRKR